MRKKIYSKYLSNNSEINPTLTPKIIFKKI